MSGFIQIDRRILRWEWYQDSNMVHLFLHLLLKANHQDGSWKGIKIKRGQLITGRIKLATDVGLTEMQVRTCLNKLKSTNEISTKISNKFTVITICKYETYQNKQNKDNQQSNQQVIQQVTNEHPTSNQQVTTNNNDNNDNNDKENNYIPENDFSLELPEIRIGMIQQLMKLTLYIDLSAEQILGLWDVFKKEKLSKTKKYKVDDFYTYFGNWLKLQKFTPKEKTEDSVMKDMLPHERKSYERLKNFKPIDQR